MNEGPTPRIVGKKEAAFRRLPVSLLSREPYASTRLRSNAAAFIDFCSFSKARTSI
jgi:hypothetical protein